MRPASIAPLSRRPTLSAAFSNFGPKVPTASSFGLGGLVYSGYSHLINGIKAWAAFIVKI